MKLSVSLPEADVVFVDDYADQLGVPSRSAVIHRAIELLRLRELEEDYAEAWESWASDPDAPAWDAMSADGLDDAQG